MGGRGAMCAGFMINVPARIWGHLLDAARPRAPQPERAMTNAPARMSVKSR